MTTRFVVSPALPSASPAAYVECVYVPEVVYRTPPTQVLAPRPERRGAVVMGVRLG